MEVTLFLSGILLGVFAGLMPGIGVFTTLILIYPLLLDLTISQLLILYIPLLSISQYLGSVPHPMIQKKITRLIFYVINHNTHNF